MTDFVFQKPDKIIFGEEAELKIVADIKDGGYKKTMIIYGMGRVNKTASTIESSGKDYQKRTRLTDFGGVRPNPVLSFVYDGIEWARKMRLTLFWLSAAEAS